MKVHHVAHYEYGSRPHSEMREKEFPTSSYTLFNSDRYEIDSFCIYIHDDTSRDYEETKVLDIASLISMEIKKKSFEDIVEEM